VSNVHFVKSHPVIVYFVLAFVLTWWMFPLLQRQPLLGVLGLFGPALAAIVLAAMLDGRSGVLDLLNRVVRWRVSVRWYAVAVGGPALLALAAAGIAVLLGASSSVQVGTLSIFDFVIFLVVVGEELGWRGFALPRLLQRHSALIASLLLGLLWSAWHLPTFLVPGTPQYGRSILAFVVMTTIYSVLLCWLFLHAAGSVLLATLAHGAINLFQGVFFGGVDPAAQYWLMAGVYGVAALVVLLMCGPGLSRRPSVTAEPFLSSVETRGRPR
jgi:membrane protease YdiL (CAAX protease family)